MFCVQAFKKVNPRGYSIYKMNISGYCYKFHRNLITGDCFQTRISRNQYNTASKKGNPVYYENPHKFDEIMDD